MAALAGTRGGADLGGGGADERTRLLFFPLSAKRLGGPSRDLGRGERGRHFWVLSRLGPKLCLWFGFSVRGYFSPKSIVHDLYLSLGTVMGMLLEAILEHGFRIVCEPMQAFEL